VKGETGNGKSKKQKAKSDESTFGLLLEKPFTPLLTYVNITVGKAICNNKICLYTCVEYWNFHSKRGD